MLFSLSKSFTSTAVGLAVAEGQHVQAGDLLMEIDPSEYRAAVDALRATISSARADLELARASLAKAEQDRTRAEELTEFDETMTAREAALREVRVGRSNGLQTQLLDGLAEGAAVIVHPDETIEDGTRVVTFGPSR